MQTIRGGIGRKFGQTGLYVLGAVVFTASHAWAVPFTGAGQGSFTVRPAAQTLTIQGYTTVGGGMMCNGVQTNFEYIDPTGACGAEETESRATVDYSCQFEGSEDFFIRQARTRPAPLLLLASITMISFW